jgi:hypothetical protein
LTPLTSIAGRVEKVTPGPWKGDRYDGTVKYELVGEDHSVVIRGDNGNSDSQSSPYGILNKGDEDFIKHSRSDIPYLLSLIKAKDEALKKISMRTEDSVPPYRVLSEMRVVQIADEARSLGHEESK